MNHRIDPDTAERVALALAAGRKAGLDDYTTLDTASLLLTPQRKIEIQKATLRQVYALLENPAHRLLTQGSGNLAEDLRRNLLERIDEWLNLL